MIINNKNFELFIPSEEIAEIVSQLADAVNKDYRNKEPFFIVMLNGAFMFAADFLRQMRMSVETAFVRYSSYEGMNSTGAVKRHTLLPDEAKGRHVVVLEDVVDTGTTMACFLEELKEKLPASISVVSLLMKPQMLQTKITIDYVGKEIGNRFIVGYGLDYNGFGRNLDAIYVIKE